MDTHPTACGIYNCPKCEHLGAGECMGCRAGNSYLNEAQQHPCAVYVCVESHGYKSCEDCVDGPCGLRRIVETICPIRSRFENKRWWAGKMSRALSQRGRSHAGADGEVKTSQKVINRLRWYLTALDAFTADGYECVSSWQLAEKVGVNAALIRKDLAKFGDFGTPSLGYRIDFLSKKIRGILGLDKTRQIVWVGARCLRLHESTVAGLAKHGCRLLAVFDVDESEVGTSVCEMPVLSKEMLAEFVEVHDIDTAAIAVAGSDAQEIANILAEKGVSAILNISGELLVLPDKVRVSSIDIVGELLELCYYSDPE